MREGIGRKQREAQAARAELQKELIHLCGSAYKFTDVRHVTPTDGGFETASRHLIPEVNFSRWTDNTYNMLVLKPVVDLAHLQNDAVAFKQLNDAVAYRASQLARAVECSWRQGTLPPCVRKLALWCELEQMLSAAWMNRPKEMKGVGLRE